MAGRFFLLEGVHVRIELAAGDTLRLGNVIEDRLACGFEVFRSAIEFGAVAGRQHGGFMDAARGRIHETFKQSRDRIGHFFRAEGDAFAYGQRRRRMVET